MSYVRWSGQNGPWDYESQVYIYDDVAGGTTCCGCWLDPEGKNWRGDLDNSAMHPETIAHVREHIAAGHKVPEFVIPRLADPANGGFN